MRKIKTPGPNSFDRQVRVDLETPQHGKRLETAWDPYLMISPPK